MMRSKISLIIGATLLLLPASARAELPSLFIKQALWMADQGLNTSKQLTESACGESQRSDIENVLSVLRTTLDVRNAISGEIDAFKERTVCYRYDLSTIDEKMQAVRDDITTAANRCERQRLYALSEIYDFLAQVRTAVADGGLNPGYHTDVLRRGYRWLTLDAWNGDQPVENTAEPRAEQCPFATDYGPSSFGIIPYDVAGKIHKYAGVFYPLPVFEGSPDLGTKSRYGCDDEVLQYLPFEKEVNELRAFRTATTDFSLRIRDLIERFFQSLRAGTHSPAPELSPPQDLGHVSFNGCLRPGLMQDGSVIKNLELLVREMPGYFDRGFFRWLNGLGSSPDEKLFSFSPRGPESPLPTGNDMREQSHFSLYPEPLLILKNFFATLEQRTDTGSLPMAFYRQSLNSIANILGEGNADTHTLLEKAAGNMAREGAFIDALARDPIGHLDAAYAPLDDARKAIGTSVMRHLPGYIGEEMGYFLSRHCNKAHCDQSISTLIQRSFNPACHGNFAGNSEENDFWHCYCISQDDDSDSTLPKDSDGDGKTDGFYRDHCDQTPTEEEKNAYAKLEPNLIEGCKVDGSDPEKDGL